MKQNKRAFEPDLQLAHLSVEALAAIRSAINDELRARKNNDLKKLDHEHRLRKWKTAQKEKKHTS